MRKPDIIEALEPLIDIFEKMKIDYYIGGSIASSAHGIARATMDVDIVADMKPRHTQGIVKSLKPQYYVNSDTINQAIRKLSSFNLIHLETMIKIDVFIFNNNKFNRETFKRRYSDSLDISVDRKFLLPSPEDIILTKLDWYKRGGETSNQRWKGILGVLKVQGNSINLEYLQNWSNELNLVSLMEKALIDAGIKNRFKNQNKKST